MDGSAVTGAAARPGPARRYGQWVLTHIVLIEIAPDATAEQVDALVEGLRSLPAQIPEIGTYQVARDAAVTPGNHQIGILATFASAEDLRTYAAHPAHVRVVEELLAPISPERARIQMDL